MRIAAPAFGPATLIGIRLGLAALLLAGVAIVTGRALPWGANWQRYFVIGAINSAAPFLLFAYAAQTLPASVLSLFNSLAPICGAVVAALWLKTPIGLRAAFGLACGVAGVGVLTLEHLAVTRIDGNLATLVSSFAAALGAPILYGVAATYIKRNAVKGDPFSNAHGSMWAASVLAAPFAFAFAPSVAPVAPVWSAAIVLGLLCTGAAYILQFKLIADLGPTRALTVAFLIPVFGVLWGVLFLGESTSVYLLTGGALIVLGMYLTIGGAIIGKPAVISTSHQHK
jgi:drug/metabolite transporter (DMT)-like permease